MRDKLDKFSKELDLVEKLFPSLNIYDKVSTLADLEETRKKLQGLVTSFKESFRVLAREQLKETTDTSGVFKYKGADGRGVTVVIKPPKLELSEGVDFLKLKSTLGEDFSSFVEETSKYRLDGKAFEEAPPKQQEKLFGLVVQAYEAPQVEILFKKDRPLREKPNNQRTLQRF